MDALCCELILLILSRLPTRDKCALMATCHWLHDSLPLRAAIGEAKRIFRRTASRQVYRAPKELRSWTSHPSKKRRDAAKLRNQIKA